jgi:uncharacterized protein
VIYSRAMRVTALWMYPIKSCRGVPVPAATAGRRGFDGDRRWMIVDEAGRFLTQRELPRMTLVRCALGDDTIEVSAEGQPALSLPRALEDGARAEVEIWGDTFPARVHSQGSEWFTRTLGRPCRAVYMPDEVARTPGSGGRWPEDRVGFADGYPYLLATETSLAELNRRLPEPITMERFRPNIVVDGQEPFAEDDWRRLRVGELPFRVPKGCDRCAITTVDPDTGATGREPLRTLATFRRRDGAVWFGVNLIPDAGGRVRVGDPLAVA